MGFWDKILYDYSLSFIGTPYLWGGNNPLEGMDCSGFVCELLRSVGELNGDYTSQGILDYYDNSGRANMNSGPTFGAVVFYGTSSTKVRHVAFCLDAYRVIEAGGGGRNTDTLTLAASQDAYVRIRLIKHRADIVGMIKPYYVKVGGVRP